MDKVYSLSLLLLLLAANCFAAETGASTQVLPTRASDSAWVDSVCPGRARPCLDSLSQALTIKLRAAVTSAEANASRDYEAEARDERLSGYILTFAADMSETKSRKGNGSSGGNSNYKDWGAAVLIVAGVVVVGAVIIGVPYFAYRLFKHDEPLPAFRELSLRYAYAGSSWDGGGSPLYRHTQVVSARFTLGLRRPYVGLGLTADGGYLSAHFEDIAGNPDRTLNSGGPFFLLGPSLLLGGERFFGEVDFLNGADFVNGAGWMTEGRFALKGRVGERLLLGAYIGSLFYDMRLFDGLAWRRGSFNRDVSLLAGFETGIAF